MRQRLCVRDILLVHGSVTACDVVSGMTAVRAKKKKKRLSPPKFGHSLPFFF